MAELTAQEFQALAFPLPLLGKIRAQCAAIVSYEGELCLVFDGPWDETRPPYLYGPGDECVKTRPGVPIYLVRLMHTNEGNWASFLSSARLDRLNDSASIGDQ